MAAAMRSAATVFLRHASSADVPFLGPLMRCSDHFLVGSVPIAVNSLDLAPRPTSTLAQICVAAWTTSLTPRFPAYPQEMCAQQFTPSSSVRKLLVGLGACSIVASIAYEGSTTESYICMAGSQEERIRELQDEVKAKEEENRILKKQIGVLKLGEELEKLRIRSKRFLVWQLIVRDSKGGGSGGPKKRTPYEWIVFCLEGPKNIKAFLLRQNESSRAWMWVGAIVIAVPCLTWQDIKDIGSQLLRGEIVAVLDSIRVLLDEKVQPLPVLHCRCGSALSPVAVCASCGLLVGAKEDGGAGKEDGGAAKEDGGAGKEDGGAGKEDGGASAMQQVIFGLI